MFGGYPSFVRIPRALAAGRSAAWALRAAGAAAAVLGPARRRAQWRHLLRDPADPAEVYRAQRGLFMPEEAEALAGPRLLGSLPALQEEGRERDRQRLAPLGAERPHAAVARMETVHYLSAQLLRDIDVMSMAHSLEVRVPFADPGVLAATWPAAGRRPGLLRGKRILHRGLRLPLPPAAVRGPKRGFTLPFERWMRGELREPLREGIEALCRDGWVDADAAGRVRRAWERGKVHWSRPWALGILGLFLEGAGRPEEPQA
jgi:asparagine synthase (glutamine-hydrolysing)